MPATVGAHREGVKIAMALIVMAGCSSLRGKGDAAYTHGDYASAAELYDRAVKGGDRDAIPLRTKAREEELRVELFFVQTVRAAGADPTGKLAMLLDQRDAWGGDGAAALADAIAFEVSAESVRIASEVDARSGHDGPLAGEAVARGYEKLLARKDFASVREAIRVQLAEAGARRCTQLEAASDTPYWRTLTARYCGHWAVVRAVPSLPDHDRGVAIDGAIAGESTDELAALRGALQAAFAKSAWYAPTGALEASASVGGRVDAAFSSREVTLTASWTEQVPYTDYETTQESYQEPYDDTETYEEQVPSTEDVPCGDTTCPQTVFHSETRTRTVTKYRTAWRDVTTPVTKVRDEPHVEDYAAVERTGTYASELHVETGGVVASVAHSTSASGYDHDVTIGAAGVSPQRANLPTHEQFAAREHQALADQLVEQLDSEYSRRFCTRPEFTLEQAAECAYGGADGVPAAGKRALAQVLGGEVAYLAALER